jgi:hypothetical protein
MMFYPTTVSLLVRADLQEDLARFVHQKTWPGARLRLAGSVCEHRFSPDHAQHRFTVTASLAQGDHTAELEFLDRQSNQGALVIESMWIQGAPLGITIYQSEYRAWHQPDQTLRGHLYLGWPGVWQYPITAPVTHSMGGVGFE